MEEELSTYEAIQLAIDHMMIDGHAMSDEEISTVVKKLQNLTALLTALPFSPDDL